MKKVLLLCLFLSVCVNSQWQPDVRLTNNSALSYMSYNNGRCIAAIDNTLHVIWYDFRDGNQEIYYKRSTDGGTSWGNDTRLTNNSAESWRPSVSVSGQVVHVVWYDLRDGNYEIYYKRSTDAGATWGADTRLTNDAPGISAYPSIFASGSAIHIAWMDTRHGGVREMYYIRSTDGGNNWEAEIRLTNDPADSRYPTVSASGSLVHTLFTDARDGNYEVYYKRSTDGGVIWGADTRLTNTPTLSEYPSLSSSGSLVHVLWTDGNPSAPNIFYKRSTDGGLTWQSDIPLTNNTSTYSIFPSIVLSNSIVHIGWQDNRDGNYEIYYKQSLDEGVTWSANSRLTTNSFSSESPFITVSGTALHLTWQDNRDGNYEIYYKLNPTGNPIGIHPISNEIPNQFSLSQNYPNPFNPTTKIQFALPVNSFAKLVIYDALGRELETIVSEQLNAGTYEADWNADKFSSGVYYYRIAIHSDKLTARQVAGSSTGDYIETRKMVLMK